MNYDLDFIKNQTNKCVYCGLCSSVCPTYALTQSETESPRGRVIAMQQQALNNIPANHTFIKNIQYCLQCGRCDHICPAHIPISTLVSHNKSQFPQKNTQHYLWATKHSPRLAPFFPIAKKLKPSLVPKAMRLTSTLKAQPTQETATLGLFTGCTGNTFDKDTLLACQNLLYKRSIPFMIPKKQQCCGTLHQHEGDFDSYHQLQHQNQQAIAETKINHYLYFLSGCSTGIKALGKKSNTKTTEILDYLSSLSWSTNIFNPLDITVLIHLPCTTTPETRKHIQDLLAHIPKLKLQFIDDAGACCGSAGLYMRTHPNRAKVLREPFIDAIEKYRQQHTQAEYWVLTTNIGCRLHLAEGLHKNNVKIAHPVFLLNQQLCS